MNKDSQTTPKNITFKKGSSTIKVPLLALKPIAPLYVQSHDISFDMNITASNYVSERNKKSQQKPLFFRSWEK